jgi:TRAP-type C4-dicarboxylate transport system permease small subunit
MGDKLWPEHLLPWVKKVTHVTVAVFCFGLAILGLLSVVDHYEDWVSGPGAGLIPSIDWPKWLVFAIIPYAFGMMGLRFLGRAAGLLPEPKPQELPT